MPKDRIDVSIDREVLEEFDAWLQKTGGARSPLIQQWVTDFLKKQKAPASLQDKRDAIAEQIEELRDVIRNDSMKLKDLVHQRKAFDEEIRAMMFERAQPYLDVLNRDLWDVQEFELREAGSDREMFARVLNAHEEAIRILYESDPTLNEQVREYLTGDSYWSPTLPYEAWEDSHRREIIRIAKKLGLIEKYKELLEQTIPKHVGGT